MDSNTQVVLTVSVPTLAVLLTAAINNARLNDLSRRIDLLEAHMNARFEDLKELWRSELRRVEEVLDARLKHLEERG